MWQCLKPLSVLVIEGKVRRSGSLKQSCLECGGATINLQSFDGGELPDCGVDRADALGNFLTRVYKKDKYFHLVAGDRGFSAVRNGPNHYQVKAYVKYKDGHWSTIGPILVIIDGETARAGRLVWKSTELHIDWVF